MIRIDRKWADKPNVLCPWPPGHRIIGLEVQVQQRSPWGENSARGICADSRYRPSPCRPHREPDAASVRSTGIVELAEAAPPPGAWAWLWYIACVRVACVRACVCACVRACVHVCVPSASKTLESKVLTLNTLKCWARPPETIIPPPGAVQP